MGILIVHINKNKREYYYYSYFLKYQSLKFYLDIYNSNDSVKVPYSFLKSQNVLKLREKEIVKKFGRPFFKEKSEIDKCHKILFYNIKYYRYDILKSFHFLNRELFFINVTFQNLKQKDKEKILDTLNTKYNVESEKNRSIKIVDVANNILFVEDIFDLSVNYLLPNIRKLDIKYDEMEAREKNIEQKEEEFLLYLFDKII